MDQVLAQEDLNAVIRQHSEWLAAQLHTQRESLFPPDAEKAMRRFTSGEAAALLGINDPYLRKLHLDGKGPSAALTPGNRRLYSAADLQDLRVLLERNARKPGDYLPGRRDGDHMQVIGVIQSGPSSPRPSALPTALAVHDGRRWSRPSRRAAPTASASPRWPRTPPHGLPSPS